MTAFAIGVSATPADVVVQALESLVTTIEGEEGREVCEDAITYIERISEDFNFITRVDISGDVGDDMASVMVSVSGRRRF